MKKALWVPIWRVPQTALFVRNSANFDVRVLFRVASTEETFEGSKKPILGFGIQRWSTIRQLNKLLIVHSEAHYAIVGIVLAVKLVAETTVVCFNRVLVAWNEFQFIAHQSIGFGQNVVNRCSAIVVFHKTLRAVAQYYGSSLQWNEPSGKLPRVVGLWPMVKRCGCGAWEERWLPTATAMRVYAFASY